jgi:quinol monooxygenase YgiN
MIYITAIIKGNPALITDLENVFEPLVTATRKEEGCQRYEVHRSIVEPATFIVMEEWQSEEHIQAHNQSAHFQHFVNAVQPLLAAPLQIYLSEKFI